MKTEPRIIDQLKRVREHGNTDNMMNRSSVQWEASKMNLPALARFCENAGTGEYLTALDEMEEQLAEER